MKQGFFITLEGGEGSGKSTLSNGLVAKLTAARIPWIQTREPGGTPVAEKLRDILLDPENSGMSHLTQALIVAAARRDHIEKVIEPALKNGQWVICDRFVDSTHAYQGGPRGASADDLAAIDRASLRDRSIDLTLLLDASPQDLLARRQHRNDASKDVFEQKGLGFHENIRATFLARAQAETKRIIVLDARLKAEGLLEAAWAAIQDRLM